MKTESEIKEELIYQQEKLHEYPINSEKYNDILNKIVTLKWVLGYFNNLNCEEDFFE